MSKKITLYDFLSLPDQEQYDISFQHGTFLDSKIYGNQRFALYAVDKFFVEVEYDNKKNKIANKRTFVHGELLEKSTSLDM